METPEDHVEELAEQTPMAGNFLRRMQNGQADYLVKTLSDLNVYSAQDFVNDELGEGPSRRTAETFFDYLTENGVLEETEDGYEPVGDVAPEDIVREINESDYRELMD
mgnify:CR=1 FL=1